MKFKQTKYFHKIPLTAPQKILTRYLHLSVNKPVIPFPQSNKMVPYKTQLNPNYVNTKKTENSNYSSLSDRIISQSKPQLHFQS